MATAELQSPAAHPSLDVLPPIRVADLVELTKPRIAAMALVTVAVGYLLGAGADARLGVLLHTLAGAGLVAAGGSALNCWLEQDADRRMRRTANRPLPAGRLLPELAAGFGLLLTVAGTVHLALTLPSVAAAVTAAATAALYVGVYTPLKRVSAWNTVVGAVPGALPPVIGWCAARGTLSAEGLSLFAILFVWQLPHFYSIAWMHRDDYARGGMRMLPVVDAANGRRTGLATAATGGLLVLATLAPLPYLPGWAGWVYATGAVPLSVWFLLRCVRFARQRSQTHARGVLRGSLLHLVGVMALLCGTGVVPKLLS